MGSACSLAEVIRSQVGRHSCICLCLCVYSFPSFSRSFSFSPFKFLSVPDTFIHSFLSRCAVCWYFVSSNKRFYVSKACYDENMEVWILPSLLCDAWWTVLQLLLLLVCVCACMYRPRLGLWDRYSLKDSWSWSLANLLVCVYCMLVLNPLPPSSPLIWCALLLTHNERWMMMMCVNVCIVSVCVQMLVSCIVIIRCKCSAFNGTRPSLCSSHLHSSIRG